MTDAIHLRDDEYWTDPLQGDPPERKGRFEPPPTGLIIGAPEVIAYRSRATFPVVVRRTAPVLEHAMAPFKRYAIVTAVDVSRNEIFTGHALDVDGAIWIEPNPDAKYVGMESAPYVLELRDRCAIPWRAAEYLVTVVIRDQTSNRARVRVAAQPPGAYEDPEVTGYLEARRGQTEAAQVWPPEGASFPAYHALPASPPIPDKEGIAITAERVVVHRRGARALVHGAFRLRVGREDFAAKGPELSVRTQRPTAITTVHVMATGSADATPMGISLRAPSYDPIPEGASSAVVTGYFAFDALELMGIGSLAQTFFVYALSREVMTGPVPMAIVTEDMLPPRAL